MVKGLRRNLNRRSILKVVGASGLLSLAGCFGSDENEDLGEPVPPLIFQYFANDFTTPYLEAVAPNIAEDWMELGIDVEIEPTEVGTMVGDIWDNSRDVHVAFWTQTAQPDRLDPLEVINRASIDFAGPGGGPNSMQYASCEYTQLAKAQDSEPDPDRRMEIVHDAFEIASNDIYCLGMVPSLINGAYNSDSLDIEPGSFGLSYMNSSALNSMSINGNQRIIIGLVLPSMFDRMNYFTNANPPVPWNHMLGSPLITFDENLNLQNILIDEYEISNEGRTVTVNLRDDIFFHNGDPITSEEVKWTWDTISQLSEEFPQVIITDDTFDSIETLDELTVQFNLPEPFPPLITRVFPRWGILHPSTWEGIREGTTDFDPDLTNYIGTGPFELEDFETRQFLALSPFDNHPIYNPQAGVVIQAFESETSAVESLLAEEIHMLLNITEESFDRVVSENRANISTRSEPSFMGDPIYPQMDYGPTKFREFRDALGKAVDLNLVNEIGRFGNSEPDPYAMPIAPSHPFRPSNDRLHYFGDPGGDIEEARNVLEENGWGWDADGNLHYPLDYDIEPLWPENRGPSSEDGYGCLDEEGNYVG